MALYATNCSIFAQYFHHAINNASMINDYNVNLKQIVNGTCTSYFSVLKINL